MTDPRLIVDWVSAVGALLLPDRVATSTELWIVDPTVRWPAGLLTRSAWRLFIPIFAHIVRDAMSSRMPGIKFNLRDQDGRITVLAPTRSYKDPVILVLATFLLTTLFWLVIHPHLTFTGPTGL